MESPSVYAGFKQGCHKTEGIGIRDDLTFLDILTFIDILTFLDIRTFDDQFKFRHLHVC